MNEQTSKSGFKFVFDACYDKNEDEVLFMTSDSEKRCLAYQNKYGVFSSFYDYQGWVSNLGRHSINITGGSLYFMRESDKYNNFYGNGSPYWVSFVVSP